MFDSAKQANDNLKSAAFTKDLTVSDMMVKLESKEIDTVLVRRIDSNEDEVYDLHKPQDLINMANRIQHDGNHLLGWKAINRHVEDRAVASAIEIDGVINSTKEPEVKVTGASFVKGFTPPDNVEMGKASAGDGVVVKKNKGQYNNMNNDDGGDILAVWKPSPDKLKKQVKRVSSKSGVGYFVSFPFPHLNDDHIDFNIVMDIPYEAWFLQAAHISCMFCLQADDIGYELPHWQKSFREVAIRKQAYGDNEYKRRLTGKGNSAGRTINKISFVFRIKKSETSMFHPMLMSAFKKIERLFHRMAQPGASCLTYMKENAPGIVDYFRKQYPSDDKLEMYLNDTLVECFSRQRNVVLDTHLDRFYMDNTIKEFLKATGVHSWETVGDISTVYKDWPKAIQQWDNIEHKPYDE